MHISLIGPYVICLEYDIHSYGKCIVLIMIKINLYLKILSLFADLNFQNVNTSNIKKADA